MTAVLDAPTTRSTTHDTLLERLLDRLATRLVDEPPVPAVYLRGLDTHQASQILRAELPAVVHRQRVYDDHDEHLLLDTASGDGARVDLRWDSQAHTVTATVAETHASLLFQRIAICMNGWDLAGRTIPNETGK